MRQQTRDLFGEVPVTWPEVWAWLEAVPRISRDSPRAMNYIRGYDVPGKIARAKLEGWYESAVQQEPPPPHWWKRFRWN